MAEQILEKITGSSRTMYLMHALDKCELKVNPDGSTTHTILPLKESIALLMEQAYIAGANRANLSEAQRKPLQESGEILTLARNFVKDKGLRI